MVGVEPRRNDGIGAEAKKTGIAVDGEETQGLLGCGGVQGVAHHAPRPACLALHLQLEGRASALCG